MYYNIIIVAMYATVGVPPVRRAVIENNGVKNDGVASMITLREKILINRNTSVNPITRYAYPCARIHVYTSEPCNRFSN